jgi:hypothetical protein
VKFVLGQHAQDGGYRFFWRIRFLVALPPVWELLLFAKNLFVAANIVWHEVPPSRGEREAIRQLSAGVPLSYRTRAPLMASQDTVLSVPAGLIRCQQLPVRHLNRRMGSTSRHSTFVAEMIGLHRNEGCCAGPPLGADTIMAGSNK